MNDALLWITVAAAALISVGAALWSLWPMLQPGRAQPVLEDDRLADLLARKDAALTAIKDLEFDYHVGKIGEEDFRRVNERLRRQAIGLMEQLDKLAPESAALDAHLEAEIAKLRKTQPQRAPAVTPAPARAAAPVNGHTRPRFCTNCGHPLEPAHKFCANCGTPVAAVAAADGEKA
jgi:NADH pyrophosphatase NudC (nudix superfamily)